MKWNKEWLEKQVDMQISISTLVHIGEKQKIKESYTSPVREANKWKRF